MLGLVLAIAISLILIFLIYKESRLTEDGDLFMGVVITFFGLISAAVDIYTNKFDLSNISVIAYIFVIMLSIAYCICFFIKYKAYKKNHQDDDSDVE